MIYWTLELPDKPTEIVYGSRQDLSSWLKNRQLCRRAPTDWIIDVLGDAAVTERFTYTHMPGEEPLWTLTWGKPVQGVHQDIA